MPKDEQEKLHEARIDIERLFAIVTELKEEGKEQKKRLTKLEDMVHAAAVDNSKEQARLEARIDYLEEQLKQLKEEREKQFHKMTTLTLVIATAVGVIVQLITLIIEHVAR